jgi:hypothetical protein
LIRSALLQPRVSNPRRAWLSADGEKSSSRATLRKPPDRVITRNRLRSPRTTERLLSHFEGRFRRRDFYILCPNNVVTPELDAARIIWGARDMTENRPAHSRRHPDWKACFDAFVAKETDA